MRDAYISDEEIGVVSSQAMGTTVEYICYLLWIGAKPRTAVISAVVPVTAISENQNDEIHYQYTDENEI